jgi:hypothetical protein
MASFKKCIELKCKDCTYDSAEPGTWREQVEACTIYSCALWEVRPISSASTYARRKSRSDADAKADAIIDSLEDEE